MKRTTRNPAPKAKSLAQQQTDFTSEGSPPPGKVATEVPLTKGNGAKNVTKTGRAKEIPVPRSHPSE